MDSNRSKKKYLVINLLLFAFLYFSVSFNKEYIRPIYADKAFWGILTGSYSNFMAAYVISLCAIPAIFARNLMKQSRMVFYTVSGFIFLLLMFEEISPFAGVSKVCDIYDILASALGSLFAIFTFEIIFKKRKHDKQA